MKRCLVLPVIAVALLLAGCVGAPQKPAVTVTITPTPSAAAAADTVPSCQSFLGKPMEQVVVEGHGPQCITGLTAASDKTVYSLMNCDPVGNSSTPVYGWSSDDASAPDQNVYVAKKGGVVMLVPNGASLKAGIGVMVASYLATVGCP